ncbi:tRNA (5-methylaminomethyl-2-thiouridylate)-methyltransferase [Thioflavicoccus mobilis 8321]|uniref:tRNA-specific 2-thiouridylase MnmA n=1 Tax=Thioflavicoccus mobilis 8321 TaxID=765912 RepID=L0GYE4_9GAMM|nr:tRNA 2-thiouridine(34) synthase MnmA [Thioflavicoccus mobilis]AGA90847.1 tRNA (5-methylaminomethyl-2-thiouridylate)-methyltransferase [Thioflavicoccus mobilis 8321]
MTPAPHPQNASPAGETVVVGLSGGVDSAVAALRLLEQGYDVHGLFMKNWEEDDDADYCAAAADLADARAVAEHLGIRLHTANFAAEYWDRVFTHFLAEYRAGRTPNPDVLCNREIKFQAFLDHALWLGADRIATGHYARLALDEDGARLHLCADPDKDQTYFLYLLNQEQLRHSRFPLADLTKAEVRRIARHAGLANAAKKDSTGICFIGERRFRDFLARYLPPTPGPIETPEGRVLGEHRGVAYYTIGQRQGLGIGGLADGDEAPWFVARKEPVRNALIVVQGGEHPLLMSHEVEGTQLHWIAGHPPGPLPYPCRARLRHRQALQDCQLLSYDGSTCRVAFEHPQRAVTPGQSIVLYRDDECLGGAVIAQAA